MLLLLIAIMIALAAWLMFEPDWMPKPPENDLSEKVTNQAKQLKIRSGGWFQKTRQLWAKKVSLGEELKAWVLQDDLAKTSDLPKPLLSELAEFQIWIGKISDKEANAIAEDLARFCRARGMDLRWLFEEKGSVDMQSALSGLVLYYCLAVRERANSRPAAALRAWEEAPLAKANREFGNRLYVQLVDAKLAEMPTSLLVAPEKERQAHVVSSIKTAIPTHREQVIAFSAKALEGKQTAKPEQIKAVKKNKKEPLSGEEQPV